MLHFSLFWTLYFQNLHFLPLSLKRNKVEIVKKINLMAHQTISDQNFYHNEWDFLEKLWNYGKNITFTLKNRKKNEESSSLTNFFHKLESNIQRNLMLRITSLFTVTKIILLTILVVEYEIEIQLYEFNYISMIEERQYCHCKTKSLSLFRTQKTKISIHEEQNYAIWKTLLFLQQ